MKIIFAGTTEFGIPTLEKLKSSHELVLIITQPDRPTGRNQKLTPPAIKVWAEKNNIPVIQPEKIIDDKLEIINREPDLLLVAAYGQIIPAEILDIPKFKSINIHGSILPKYRGASPIQAAILNGEPNTGITLIQMDEQMDHGAIIAVRSIKLSARETFRGLYKDLSLTSAELVSETLPKWFAGEIKPVGQIHDQATFCHQLNKKDGLIDWKRPAVEIDRQIRALNPEPGTWTRLSGKIVKILAVEMLADNKIELPGKLYVYGGEPAVKTLDNGLVLKRVQSEGKLEMSGKDYLNGLKNLNDKIFI